MPRLSLLRCRAPARHRLVRASSGIAAVEFAIGAAFFLFTVTALYDFGRASWRKLEVTTAAQAGAVYVASNGMNLAGITAAIANATSTSGISATPAPVMACGCPNGASGITPAACSTTCPAVAGQPTQYASYYATISARGTYTFMFPYPYVSSPIVITAKNVVRLQ